MIVPLTAACLLQAAATFGLPAQPLWGILDVERGHVGQAVGNVNGTQDLGPFQINTIWLDVFRRYWKLPDDQTAYRRLRDDGCANAEAAAAILAYELHLTHDLPSAVGRYHSATPALAGPYLNRVTRALHQLYTSSR